MKRCIATATLMMAVFMAQPASAATYVFTYEGIIATQNGVGTGYDPYDYFGTGDISLTGQAVKASFTYNTINANTGSSSSLSYINGAGISSAKIIINGKTLDITGTAFGAAVIKNAATDSIDNYVVAYNDYGPAAFTTSQYLAIPGKMKLDAGVGVANQPNSFLSTALLGQTIGYLPAGDAFGHFTVVDTTTVPSDILQGYYQVSSVSVAAVPEPATWAMMLVGLGAVGFAVRRRRWPVPTTVSFA